MILGDFKIAKVRPFGKGKFNFLGGQDMEQQNLVALEFKVPKGMYKGIYLIEAIGKNNNQTAPAESVSQFMP